MRPGVTWSDGTPFTAEDVRFQFQYIRDSHDPAYVGPQAPNGNDLVDGDGNPTPDGSADNPLSLFDSYLDLDGGLENSRITSIEAPDDATLVITTSAPLATLEQIFIPILPKHIWQDITFEDAAISPLSVEQSVGTGPFRMVQFEPEQAVILEARDDYWAGAPYIDELVYQFFDNDEAQVNALIAGDVDYLNIFPPTLAQKLLEAPGVTVNGASSSDLGELGFNSWAPTPERFIDEGCADCPKGPTTGSMGDPWLTRADVRAALAGLLDKQELIEFAQSGYADPGVSVVSPLNERFSYVPPEGDPVTFPAYTDEASQAAARAAAEQRFRDAMAAIGFTDTDGNGILNVPSDDASVAFDPEGAGSDWTLRLHVRDSDTEDKLAAPLIAKWFEDAGVAVEWQAVSTDELTRLTYPYASNADVDMYMWGWGPDPDPDFILSVFTCDQINSWNDVNYCDPAYDELYRSQRGQLDPDGACRDHQGAPGQGLPRRPRTRCSGTSTTSRPTAPTDGRGCRPCPRARVPGGPDRRRALRQPGHGAAHRTPCTRPAREHRPHPDRGTAPLSWRPGVPRRRMPMGSAFLARKLGGALLTLFAIAVLNFFLFRMLPGDPVNSLLPRNVSQAQKQALRLRLGLDQPIFPGVIRAPAGACPSTSRRCRTACWRTSS